MTREATFRAVDPASGEEIGPDISIATPDDVAGTQALRGPLRSCRDFAVEVAAAMTD